jgi:LCP family protein required for cell wall assembly
MSKFEFLKNIKFGRPTVKQMIFWGVTLALSIAAFIFISNFTQCWTLTSLPGIPPASCGVTTNGEDFTVDEQGTPIADLPPAALPVADNLPPAWDGASRINILFMGMDARDLEENNGPPRTDSMILFTIDPITKTGGMLSIPRDMWVNIPGFGYSRINTAYPSGEGAQLPGGGHALAMKTVSQFIGVPVDYYVQVDFVVFETMVDEIIKIGGCLQVYPTEKMILDPIGPGLDKVKLTTGGYRDLCDGWKVLAYARNRKTSGGDADRARRQQEVIFALQKIIFTPENFPKFIQKSTTLYKQLGWGIKTNLTFDDALQLAVLGRDISRDSIKTGVIDPQLGMAVFDNTTLGGEDASVLKPITEQIRILRDDIFTAGGALSPIAQGDAATLMREEGSRVRIMDGTFSGLDQRAGAFFQSYGMNVTEVAPSPESYSSSIIIVYGPDLYTIRWLQSTFGFSDRQIRFQPDPNATVDIEIRLGSDIAGSIP